MNWALRVFEVRIDPLEIIYLKGWKKGTIQGWVLLKKHFQNRKLNQPVKEKYTDLSQNSCYKKDQKNNIAQT